MAELSSHARPFSSKGLMLKQDTALLSSDTYAELTNLVVIQEGTLSVRQGHQRISGSVGPGLIHSITSLIIVAGGPRTYYMGDGLGRIWAAHFVTTLPPLGSLFQLPFVVVAVPVSNTILPYTDQRFSSADYAAGATGKPYKFFGCPSAMLKDNGSFGKLQKWGILSPPVPPSAGTTNAGVGPAGFITVSTPYSYVYTFRNPVTGAESNPSQLMIQQNWVSPNGHPISVLISASGDTQIIGPNSIAVYRAGGSFADGLYRFLGYTANPAGNAIYLDTFQDSDIINNRLVQFDNDPPVPSALPSPAAFALNGWVGSTGAPGTNHARLFQISGPPAANISAFLLVGSIVTIAIGTAAEETVVLEDVSGVGLNIVGFTTQRDHSTFPVDFTTTFLYCDTVAGAPASLTLAALDSVFVAGDPNNPHVLYKSKPGQPESFPIVQLATGVSQTINVGSPSNPINGLAEVSGGVLCLNRDNLYYVAVAGGVMEAPIATPAQRGLIVRNAWVKADQDIWYLSYDGIYSWSGGQSTWRSEAIDPLFHGFAINNYLPIDLRVGLGSIGADVVTMTYANNEIFITYTDINQNGQRLRYHTKFNRWSIEALYDPNFIGPSQITAQFAETDTGNVFVSKSVLSNSYLYLDNIGFGDGAYPLPGLGYDYGHPILWVCTPQTISGPPAEDKLFSDFLLEASTFAEIDITAFYDFDALAPDPFIIPPQPVLLRKRYPFAFRASQGKQGYALTLRLSGETDVLLVGTTLFSITLNVIPLALYTNGRAFDWDDLGWPNDKTLRVLNLECDSGGIPATAQIQGDGANLGPVLTFTTTPLDRNRILTLPSNLTARLFRLILIPGIDVFIPGVGLRSGYIKYYKHSFDSFKEPAAVSHFDTYEITFFDGFSVIKQVWLEYQSLAAVTVTFFRDNDEQFFLRDLPAHPQRDMERLYLPAAALVAGRNRLNKSTTHRMTVDSSGVFKLYQDGSRMEWMACGADQRAAYQQTPLSTLMAPQV